MLGFCVLLLSWYVLILLLTSFSLDQVKWYLKAAEGGYARAMYNTSLCYSFGEGLTHSHKLARKWMKRAADRGHSKAQFEHGLALFSVRIFPFLPQLCTFHFYQRIVETLKMSVWMFLTIWKPKSQLYFEAVILPHLFVSEFVN